MKILVSMIVAVLISQMGSDNYRTRERAHFALSKSDVFLKELDNQIDSQTDPEILQRGHELLSGYYQKTAKLKAVSSLPDGYPVFPWIDQLPLCEKSRESVIDYYLSKAREKINNTSGAPWPDYRLATKYYVEYLFSDRIESKRVAGLLSEMKFKELKWIEEHQESYKNIKLMPKAVK